MKRLAVSLVALCVVPVLAFAAASKEAEVSRASTEVKEAPAQKQPAEAQEGLICAPVPVKCGQATCSACATVGDCTAQPGCIWTGRSCI
jgi:hypothetical protein